MLRPVPIEYDFFKCCDVMFCGLKNIKNEDSSVPPLSLQQQFAYIPAIIEALPPTQLASGIAIVGLSEGMKQRGFCGQLGTLEA